MEENKKIDETNKIKKLGKEIEVEFGDILDAIYSKTYKELIKKCNSEASKFLQTYDKKIDKILENLEEVSVDIIINLENIFDLENYKLSNDEKKFLIVILERLYNQISNQLDMMLGNVEELQSVIGNMLNYDNN